MDKMLSTRRAIRMDYALAIAVFIAVAILEILEPSRAVYQSLILAGSMGIVPLFFLETLRKPAIKPIAICSLVITIAIWAIFLYRFMQTGRFCREATPLIANIITPALFAILLSVLCGWKMLRATQPTPITPEQKPKGDKDDGK